MASRPETVRTACVIGSAVLLAACTHLPARTDPPPPTLPAALPTQVDGSPLPGVRAPADGEAPQRLQPGTAPSPMWWKSFGCVTLDALIDEAQARHPDVAAAQAAIRQVQAELEAARGQYLAPQVGAQAGISRQRASGATFGGSAFEYNLFNASVGVSYSPDLFGGIRAALDGLGAQVDVQRYQLEAVRLTLSANIVTTAFREAGLRAERDASLAVQHDLEAQRDLARSRLQAGGATVAEVITAEIVLRNTIAGLPALDKAIAQTRNQLATYVGRGPGGDPLPEFHLSDFTLPPELPLSLPSEIARQRPDLRAAEASLKAADAAVGVAEANRYPSLTLSAALGQQSTTLSSLLSPASAFWSLGGAVAGTLLDGGALEARSRAARAAYEQVEAQYRGTVLLALQNVVDVLAALALDARTVDAQLASVESARASAALVEQQMALGGATRQQWLVAHINALESEIPLASQRATRLADTAALYQALGGGWSRAAASPSSVPPVSTSPSAPAP